MNRISIRLVIIGVIFMSFAMNTQAQLQLLSGLSGGTYQSLAQDIKNNSTQKINVLTSSGSVDNFNQLISNDNSINVTFLQYDVLLSHEMKTPSIRENLRVLLPLFLDEEIHLIAKKGSDITNLSDLRGKRVAVGTKGQGTFITATTIKQRTGIAWFDVEISSNDAYQALLDGVIDAYFYVGGAPVSSLSKLHADAPIQLVNIKHKALKDIYRKKKIKSGTYAWLTKTVTTYAVPTLLVVKVENMSDDTQLKFNTLVTEVSASLKKMQSSGHEKWKDVYFKNQDIDWPYYYARPIVKETGDTGTK
ncbi:MAG: TAXI family TRAP transporter solute-binding subunit [Bacteroidales bacterium]|nr:TAXI family TRAP transporter solute-binding subunit [Bacteroidales bacterium]